MEIKTIHVGLLETNCYIASNEEGECIIIDPGDYTNKIIKEIGDLKPIYIVLTHLHFDHIIAARELKKKTGAKILCHKADLEIIDEKLLKESDIDKFVEEYEEVYIPHVIFDVIHTPGHSPGSICLYDSDRKVMFSGDTIFAGSVGVTYFKGGDSRKMTESIEKKLLSLPGDIVVYPGHGPNFLLADEKDAIRNCL